MIGKLSKDEVADVARILALHAAAYARRYGELPAQEMLLLLRAGEMRPSEVLGSEEGEELLTLLRDGAAALTGVLATMAERVPVAPTPRSH
jgi:hypothetical protein